MEWQPAIKGFKSYLQLEKALSKNSIEAYSTDIDKLFQYAALQKPQLAPEQFKLNDLRNFIVWINELGMIASSQARILSGIKAFYKYLLIENVLQADPSELLEAPKLMRKLPDTLSYPEINKLIAAIDLSKPEGMRNKAILEVLYGSGLRVSELTELRLSNLFLDIEFIKVTGKGSKERLVPIGGAAINALKLWIEDVRVHITIKKGEEDLVFFKQEGQQAEPRLYFYGDQRTGSRYRYEEEDQSAYFQAFICHAPGGRRCRSAGCAGDAGTREYYHHRNLHTPGPRVPERNHYFLSSKRLS